MWEAARACFWRPLLEKHPNCQGVLFDQPEVIALAPPRPRMQRVGGSFFESVPAGGDLYTLKLIIHDWEEAKAITILQNVRKAMKPTARLMLLEAVLKDGSEPDFAKWMDINMLVIPGGQERTLEEYRELLSKTGFWLDQAHTYLRDSDAVAGIPNVV
jgi:C-methyltransferase